MSNNLEVAKNGRAKGRGRARGTIMKGSGKVVLNDQQEKFCQLYSLCMSSSQAAEDAGFHPGYGTQLLTKDYIVERIRQIHAKRAQATVIDTARIVQQAHYLAYSDITEVLACASMDDVQQLPERVRQAIEAVDETRFFDKDGKETHRKVKIKMHNKIEPLKLLGAMAIAEGSKADIAAFTGFNIIIGNEKLPPPDEEQDNVSE